MEKSVLQSWVKKLSKCSLSTCCEICGFANSIRWIVLIIDLNETSNLVKKGNILLDRESHDLGFPISGSSPMSLALENLNMTSVLPNPGGRKSSTLSRRNVCLFQIRVHLSSATKSLLWSSSQVASMRPLNTSWKQIRLGDFRQTGEQISSAM